MHNTFSGAYIQKFGIDDENDVEANENVPNEVPLQPEEVDSDENIVYRLSHLGFKLVANVTCPLPYAPRKYLEKIEDKEMMSLRNRKIKDKTFINLKFECLGASYPHLPIDHQYDFKPNDF